MTRQKNHPSHTAKNSTSVKNDRNKHTNGLERGLLPRPMVQDKVSWAAYWKTKDLPWRTEPEITLARQNELKKRSSLTTNTEEGLYPFHGLKLNRADVEWLLATLISEHEAVNLTSGGLNSEVGLDVRGADLSETDLSHLPLKLLRGGLTFEEWYAATDEQRTMSVVLMQGANLRGAELEGANLRGARLEGADLSEAQLQRADLYRAQLVGADLRRARLEGANLGTAQMERVDLSGAQLEGATLNGAQLKDANLSGAQLHRAGLLSTQLAGANLSGAQMRGAGLNGAYLQNANLFRAQFEGADLNRANLQGANLSGAQMEGVNLSEAKLEGANMFRAQLEKAILFKARLVGTNLDEAQLQKANLSEAHLEEGSLKSALLQGVNLRDATLSDEQGVGPHLADVQWSDINLAVVDWSKVTMLGDEHEARKKQNQDGEKKDKITQLEEYRMAVRANRQLVVALQAQGLNEDAVRFAYRAQRLQRIVSRRQKRYGTYLFSGFLDVIAGYGYKPKRSLIWYIAVIIGFASGYFLVTHLLHAQPYPLAWYEALILSISSFHGRGFFQPVHNLGDPVAVLASCEAIVGLIIEISFIATFTQRYFGK